MKNAARNKQISRTVIRNSRAENPDFRKPKISHSKSPGFGISLFSGLKSEITKKRILEILSFGIFSKISNLEPNPGDSWLNLFGFSGFWIFRSGFSNPDLEDIQKFGFPGNFFFPRSGYLGVFFFEIGIFNLTLPKKSLGFYSVSLIAVYYLLKV